MPTTPTMTLVDELTRDVRELLKHLWFTDHFQECDMERPTRIAILCQIHVFDNTGERYDWFHSDQELAGGVEFDGEAMDTFMSNCLLIAAWNMRNGDRVKSVGFHYLPPGQGVVVQLVNPTNALIPPNAFGITVGMASREDERFGKRRAVRLALPSQRGLEDGLYAITDWYQIGAIHFDAVIQVLYESDGYQVPRMLQERPWLPMVRDQIMDRVFAHAESSLP